MSEPEPHSPSPLITEAAEWHARLLGRTLSELETERLRAWLGRSPAHRKEFEAMGELWQDVGAIEQDLEVARERRYPQRRRLAESDRAPPRHTQMHQPGGLAPDADARLQVLSGTGRRWWSRPAPALAMAMAASVIILVAVLAWIRTGDAAHYMTRVGEQRTVSLPDGSILDLSSGTDVRVKYAPRQRVIELRGGQAIFVVAKEATRPFVVKVAGGEVRAVGTVFGVSAARNEVTVTLIEGKVAVEPALNTSSNAADRSEIYLTAGEQLSFATTSSNSAEASRPIRSRVSTWRARKLQFDNQRLLDAITEANRYSRAQIELQAPGLESSHISGSFEAGRNDLLAEGLQSYFGLRVERPDANRIVLSAPR